MEPVAQQEVHVMNAMPQSKETTMNITNDGITEINDKPLHGEWLVDRHGKQKWSNKEKEGKLIKFKSLEVFIRREKNDGFNANDSNHVKTSIFLEFVPIFPTTSNPQNQLIFLTKTKCQHNIIQHYNSMKT